ncbi:hypothetical protein ACIBKX_32300 [Streptomyces sp. NPDC050658]|uniref:hypothetical protein n=1 Tax=unclassified Streptomyces TaxID=2593676 RepID=UPI003441E97E
MTEEQYDSLFECLSDASPKHLGELSGIDQVASVINFRDFPESSCIPYGKSARQDAMTLDGSYVNDEREANDLGMTEVARATGRRWRREARGA